MIRITHLIYSILFFSQLSFSQNIFDEVHSAKYAEHLFDSENYISAAKEYMYLIEMRPENIYYLNRLIISYKKTGEIKNAIQIVNKTHGRSVELFNNELINSYLQLLFLNEDYETCHHILKRDIKLSIAEQQEYELALYLSENSFEDADSLIMDVKRSSVKSEKNDLSKTFLDLEQLYILQNKTNSKKPFVASLLSVVVPGLGKVYANDIKNGLGVLSIVGLYAWQSYRGFKHDGVKSFYGWSFGALASGFYIGNVYGSSQSAKRENEFQLKLLKQNVKHIICEYQIKK